MALVLMKGWFNLAQARDNLYALINIIMNRWAAQTEQFCG
jgi:hypothetical protein